MAESYKDVPKKVIVLACGVLRMDIAELERRFDLEIETSYLEGGLHNVPNELRTRLQEAVDRVSGSREYERIILGYGVCGRGTVGLYSRDVPLVIPRVHDCISLFLGSDAAYRKEFAGCPGTYYISAGWYDEQVQPKGEKSLEKRPQDEALWNKGKEYFAERYGEKNAEAISRFYSSWQKNYSRAAFIDTGAGDRETYGSYAKDLAEEFGWEYKRIEGTQDLLEKMFDPDPSRYPSEILVVPPNHVTEFDPKGKGLIAVPVWKREEDFDETVVSGAETPTETPTDTPTAAGPSAPPEGSVAGSGRNRRRGLGIDAGGTYTDAAVFDFAGKNVLTRAKALTTKWDFTVGITEAIDNLDSSYLKDIDLVSVSTTLATNAIVEGYGQKVGLLLMPSGVFDPRQIHNESFAVIKGRLDIAGREQEPVDVDEVERVVMKMRDKDGVNVFAVSGYAGSVNPEHELAVKAVIENTTELHVCCGHELSDLLNFYVRANTAVLNARIIPLLEQFIEDVERSLEKRNISAPVMVVKGDGSLMSSSMAKERPIETILSGPAASIAGARYLSGLVDATVVDVGGTTSDIGTIREGSVEVCPTGSRVGGWRTHVRALDMNTVGLGGDSQILLEDRKLSIGPRRIAPISWLGARNDIARALDYVERKLDYYLATTRPIEFLMATGKAPSKLPDTTEKKLLEVLEKGPASIVELTERMDLGHWLMLQSARLEEEYVVQRCGLTPTDILHVRGEMDLWDSEAAARLLRIVAERAQMDPAEFGEEVFRRITDRLLSELIRKQLELPRGADEAVGDCPVCDAVMANILAGGNARFRINAEFKHPIIGLGAPVGFFTREIPDKVDAEILIPPNADVANAVGAITSFISVVKRAHVVPTLEGGFAVQGLPRAERFEELEAAHAYAVKALEAEVIRLAEEAGTSQRKVHMHIDDRMTTIADGSELFLERILTASITGLPDRTAAG